MNVMDTVITTDNIHALESMVASLTELISVQETVVSEQSELLRQNESRFRAIFNGSNDAIMLLTEEGFFDCNPSALKIFGIATKEEFVKFTPAELSPPTQPDGCLSLEAAGEHIRTAFQTGTDRFEWIHRRSDGTAFPAEVLLSAFDWAEKRVLQATVRDISERKHAENALKESNERFRGIWESIQAGIIRVDVKTHMIIAANPQAQRMTGFSETEMAGQLCHKFICPAEEGKCPIGDLGLKIDRAERVLLSRDGTKVPILKTVTEMQVGLEKYYIENFIDITPLKDAENTLLAYFRESTLRIRNPIELVRDNLKEIQDALKGRDTNPVYIGTSLAIQEKNMDDVLNNLQALERAVAEKRTEIPDALREYLKR